MDILILDTLEDVARKSLEYVRGPRLAVSGGTTFGALFRRWAPDVRRRAQAGETLRFFAVDERKVPFEDPDCNWKSCYEELLRPAGLEDQKAHYVRSAAEYAALLRREFDGGPVIFDSLFLGMGEDGHTASLFPGKDSLADAESLVLDIADSPKPPPARVTLALKPIRESRAVIAVALGAGKAERVRQLRDGDESLPITRALKGHPRAVLLVDKAAAALL